MSELSEVAVLGIDHVQLAAPPGCEAEARRFYGAVLGLEEIDKPSALAVRGGCWFRAGDHEIHIGVAQDHSAALKAHPGLRVASVAGLHELAGRLSAAGFQVDWPEAGEIPGVTRLYTADPWGNRVELLADG